MALIPPPLISIITPVYNGAEYLDELIQSVLRQDYPNIEHLIIDDGSQDGGATVSVLQKYPHLRWWSRENKGQYATMNEGLLAAKGEIVCFVSADDVVSLGAVRTAAQFLIQCTDFSGVFGITSYVDQQGNPQPYPDLGPFGSASISFVPYYAHISHCSLYMRKSVLLKNQLLFDPSLKYVGDYEWMIRISRERMRIGVIKVELSKIRIHENQTSQIFLTQSFAEKKQVIEKHKINKVYYTILWGAYLFQFRIKKIIALLRQSGAKEVTRRLLKYYLHGEY